MTTFQLQITPSTNTTSYHGESSENRSRQTASSTNESDIIGRYDDKKNIIDFLTSSSSSDGNPEKVSVVSIVGMGGLGKTTLAQLIYNDVLVNQQFKLKMWVHVSEDFDVQNLLTKIMESATQNKFDTISNFDVLTSKVREQLNRKKYLLVLDDLWNESDEQWERLCSPLLVGAQGSKILITTRKTQVADAVKGNIPPYKLKTLQDGECWTIIEKKAFSPGGAMKNARMTSIGMEIARKCCGLPLGAKFLGSLLRTRNREVDWLSIKENEIWNAPESQSRVMEILKLSYDHLPSHMKCCFSYCAIFPKGREIHRGTLVQMWIAQGFVDTSNVGNRRTIEDIADDYFESLVWSSFFEGVENNILGVINTCKMHDLAQVVAGDQESVAFKVTDQLKDTSEIRQLRLILDADLSSSTFLKSLRNAKKLRTLFIPEGNSNLHPDVLFGHKHLRTLHIGPSPDRTCTKLPSLSFKLSRHLRYLHLTYLDLKEVVVYAPVSVSKLYNLVTLVLNNIEGSTENILRNIQSLKKLRHLNMSDTKMEELPDSVTSLCNLQSLDLSGCKLKSLPESFIGLKNIRHLDVSFNLIEQVPGSIISFSNLVTFNVKACKKLKFLPGCVKGLDNLKIFDFSHCTLLEKLPEDFGALAQLRYLSLVGTNINVLPESCVNLINLEFAKLSNCEVPTQVINNWVKLRKFHNYKGAPVGIGKLVFLEKLTYWVREKLINYDADSKDGIEELEKLNSLEELEIKNLQNVKDPVDADRANLMGKQNLRKLVLHWGELEESSDMLWDQKSCNFQVFEALQPHTGLRDLQVLNFMGCDLLTWMSVPQFQHLTDLILDGLSSVKSLDIGGFPSLVELHLCGMFSLEDMRCSPPSASLRHLWITNNTKLIEIPSFPSLKTLYLKDINHQLVSTVGRAHTSLTRLDLENVKELVYFPLNLLLRNCNLDYLSIEKCNEFQGFQVNEDQENENEDTLLRSEFHGGSLQTFYLGDCPVLKFLPDLRKWTSLQALTIRNCPEAKESLTYDIKSLSFIESLNVNFTESSSAVGCPIQ
ncbi:putative disease resistance RPP13-like protein 1 [Papaver somniferum]|uniref:putative disease resistance RPP13-like protein 1 n=1 Tax=Papaver somniferum TaxID=3469 RepID=UPI000E702751|nr:putative disease resistance RPP13-like protein 1 [Papaver somniferum]XP_026388936.1 putative disease resistance RPP13-like protein 1 [Papaver somniferum]